MVRVVLLHRGNGADIVAFRFVKRNISLRFSSKLHGDIVAFRFAEQFHCYLAEKGDVIRMEL